MISRRQEAVITVADLGEFGLIAAIQAVLPPDPAAVVGVGDDAAVLAVPGGRVVASTDLLVEGRHFRRDWSSPQDIGVKAAAQNLADIAAMGAVPTALLFGLAIPGDVAVAWVLDVTRGMVAECRPGRGDHSLGMATSPAPMPSCWPLQRSATWLAASRSPEAAPGSATWWRSAVRSAGLPAGLALLQVQSDAGRTADSRRTWLSLVEAHRRPQPDYQAGPQAATAGATAMIDVSDGLVADLGHIATASGVCLSLATA